MKITEIFRCFIKGMGSVLSLFPEPSKKPSENAEEAYAEDQEALTQDWEAVGRDIKQVMRNADEET